MARKGETWWKAATLAVAILAGMGVLGWLGDLLKSHGLAVLGAILVTVGSVVRDAAWPVAAAVVLYWSLTRQLRRALSESRSRTFGILDAADKGGQPGDLNWDRPYDIIYVEMRAPTFRLSGDRKLTAEFWVGTHERLPEETKVEKWSVTFNLNGRVLEEWIYEKQDIRLEIVGRKQLFPSPQVFVAEDVVSAVSPPQLQQRQLPVACDVFLRLRVPGRDAPVKFNDQPAAQICKVE